MRTTASSSGFIAVRIDGTAALAPDPLPAGLPFIGVEDPPCSHPDAVPIFEAAGERRVTAVSTRQAIDICEGCPYLLPCRVWALEHEECWGVWGGMSQGRRRREIIVRRREARFAALHGPVNPDADA